MQFRLFFLLLALLSFAAHTAAQPVVRTNEKGEAIIVFPDGTTQLYSDFTGSSQSSYPQQQTEAHKYPVVDVEIAPLEGSIPVTEEDLRRIAERQAQLAKNAAQIAQERAEEARQQRLLLEEEYRRPANGNSGARQRESLSARLRAARQTEQEAIREANLALQEASQAEAITRRGNYLEDYQRRQERKRQQAKQYENLKLTAATSYENLVLEDNFSPFTTTDEVILHPPAPECLPAYEGKGQQGRYRRDLQKQLLFTHTDERLRPVLRDQEYLTCEGFFTQLGGFRYLSLEFTFAYPNAREAYGFIEKGSYLMVKLLNGQFITLFSGKMDRGTYNTETELLTYRVFYPIDQSQLNILERSEVDSVIVSWSSGYEEYPVYEVGFFINQIRCLE